MLRISRSLVNEMIAHAQESLPNECCGILAGPFNWDTMDGETIKAYRMTNVAASPFRFDMDSRELVRVDTEVGDNGWQLIAIYHSHTQSEAYPSDTDIRIANEGAAALWPDTRYVLVSLMDASNPAVRLFRIDQGEVTEETLDVV